MAEGKLEKSKRKWVAGTFVLNEVHYLECYLDSVYPFVHNIVIVEGATRYIPKESKTAEGLSVDGTTELIKKYIAEKDPEKKIRYVPMGNVPTKRELQNRMLREFDKCQPDWCLVNGGDEVWLPETLMHYDDLIDAYPGLYTIGGQQRWFWVDMKHYVDISSDSYNRKFRKGNAKAFRDLKGDVQYQGYYFERCFRWQPGLHYINHPTVADQAGREIYIHPHYEPHRWFTDRRFLHFGVIKPISEIREQYEVYHIRDRKARSPEDHKKFFRENPDLKALRMGIDGFNSLKSSYEIIKYGGDYPECIKNHKWFNKSVLELSEERDVQWLESLGQE